MQKDFEYGIKIYKLIEKLYPICRSITGEGVRESLKILQEIVPIKIHSVSSLKKVLDWNVPREWNIKNAYVRDSSGKKIIDFKKNNLHILNYSVPIHKRMGLEELKPHLFTLPQKPEWIPYRTSYYKENWGFCISHNQLLSMKDDIYEVMVDSQFTEGELNYGEYLIKGRKSKEILISTYICHPSLCNDNLSGVALTTYLAMHLSKIKPLYSYRFLFIPETIGAIVWLHLNKNKLKKIKYGLVVTCVGDSGISTYKKSKKGNSDIDKIVEKVLIDSGGKFRIIDFFPSGSDERQFSSPGFNLEIGSLMRTPYSCPYGTFPQYHTSADNLDFIEPKYLDDSYKKYEEIIYVIENNHFYLNTNPFGEPQLGRRGLYNTIGGEANREILETAIMWILSYADGQNSLLDISIKSKLPFRIVHQAANKLLQVSLLAKSK